LEQIKLMLNIVKLSIIHDDIISSVISEGIKSDVEYCIGNDVDVRYGISV